MASSVKRAMMSIYRGVKHMLKVPKPRTGCIEPRYSPGSKRTKRIWDKLDPARGDGLKAGGYLHLPKDTHHYEWTDDDTVIQLSGIGPVGMTYLDPANDPRKSQ